MHRGDACLRNVCSSPRLKSGESIPTNTSGGFARKCRFRWERTLSRRGRCFSTSTRPITASVSAGYKRLAAGGQHHGTGHAFESRVRHGVRGWHGSTPPPGCRPNSLPRRCRCAWSSCPQRVMLRSLCSRKRAMSATSGWVSPRALSCCKASSSRRSERYSTLVGVLDVADLLGSEARGASSLRC